MRTSTAVHRRRVAAGWLLALSVSPSVAGGIDALRPEVGRGALGDPAFARVALDPPPPRHLVMARELVEHVQPADNAYALGSSIIRFPGDAPGARHAVKADCSGFLLALFARAGYPTRSQMVFLDDGPGRKRPRAEDFLASIERERGFRRLHRIDEIRPGDLLAHAMLDPQDKRATGTTGHVFLLASRPRPSSARSPVVDGTRQYTVTVIDSNDELVGDDDSRRRGRGAGVPGLGSGTIRLYADDDGTLVGWARTFTDTRRFFSYDPRFPSDTRRRRAVLGRVIAAE